MSLKSKIRSAKNLVGQEGLGGLYRRFRDHYLYYWRLEAELRRNPDFVPARPRVFQIEVSGRCNLRCPTCVLSQPGVQPGPLLSEEEFCAYLDAIGIRQGENVSLNGIGEALVNPRLGAFLAVLEKRGLTASLFTNGMLLNEDRSKELLASPALGFVGFSCDSANDKKFNEARKGADFFDWAEKVVSFSVRAEKQRPELFLQINTVLTIKNIDEIPLLISLAGEMGMKAISFTIVHGNSDEVKKIRPGLEVLEGLPLDKFQELGKGKGVRVFFEFPKLPSKRIRCFQPWEYIFVRANGELNPCCQIVAPELLPELGNIQGGLGAWEKGEGYHAFRRAFLDGTSPMCQGCHLYHHPLAKR